jgi:hypothetical protein
MLPEMNAQRSLGRASSHRPGPGPGRGSPLPPSLLRLAAKVFGRDFSGVRIHVGPQPGRMGALAFTLGSQIHIAPEEHRPFTQRWLQLLGHELTHVVQQREGRARNPYGRVVVVLRDPSLEAEADRMGDAFAAAASSAHGGVR